MPSENENHFTIIIPAYNCKQWVGKNLSSIFKQVYTNYDVIYIDDASTDGTGELASTLLSSYFDGENRYKVIKNSSNQKAIYNLYNSIHSIEKEDTIVVALDGDDWFSHSRVLQRLNELYDESVWITAGSYIDNGNATINRPLIMDGFWSANIRKFVWTLSHLRTFRRKLFMRINKEDLLDEDGSFFKFTWDRVLMYPMVEMAGPKHFLPISEVMYTYNSRNPLNVHKVHRPEQLRIEKVITNKDPYSRLEKL